MPQVVVTARWGIAAHDVLAIDLCGDGDMLTDGQAKDSLRMWQGKPITTQAQSVVSSIKSHFKWSKSDQ